MNLKKILLSILYIISAVYITQAQSSTELKKLRAKIDNEIAELQKVLKSKTQEKMLSQREVNALSRQINLREQKISTINSEINLINSQITSNNNQILGLKATLEIMRKDYEKMIMFAFRNKNAYNKMMFVFAAKDFNQGYKRVKYLQQFNDARKIKSAEIEQTQKEIELKIAQLEANKLLKKALLVDQQKEREIIAKDRALHSTELKQLVREEQSFKGQLSKKQQEKKRIDAQIKSAIAREIAEERRKAEEARKRAAEAEAKRTGKTVAEVEKSTPKKTDSEILRSTPEAAKLSADFKSNRGRLPWPVAQGNIVRNFGKSAMDGHMIDHPDITIRTADNAVVKAVFDGEVTVAFSNFVVIKHGEYFTSYSNLRNLSVSRGQKVSRGQQIGQSSEDSDFGFHVVGFGIYQGLQNVDPVLWIAR